MKKSILTFLMALLLAGVASAQIFIRFTDKDASGTPLTTEQLNSIETAAQKAIDILPATDRPLFKVYDAGFYVHHAVMPGGVSPLWEQIKTEVENLPSSKYYLIFGRESSSEGLNNKIRVKLKLPTTSAYSCLTEDERLNIEKYIEQTANSNLNGSYYQAEIAALNLLKDYFYKIIVCNCSTTSTDCSRFANFEFLDVQLLALGFRKKQIQLGDTITQASSGVFDYRKRKVFIDGFEYDIADQVSENISLFGSGQVYILDNESFTNGEWQTAKNSALSSRFVEYWVILTDGNKQSFLYSRYTIGALQPVAAKGNNHEKEEGLAPISPVQAALQVLGNAAVDVFFQAVIAYKLDPEVKNFYPDALGKVSYLGAAWEGLSSLVPWKKYTKGSDYIAIAMRAAGSALATVVDKSIKDPNYSWEQAWDDFVVGLGASVLTQLVFHPKVISIIGSSSQYARLSFAKGLKKLNDNFPTGGINRVSNVAFTTFRGTITKRVLSATGDVALISRVKALRGKMPSDPKRSGNVALAYAEIPSLAKQEFFAHSDIHDLSNSTIRANLPEISLKPTNKIFPSLNAPNKEGKWFDRDVDSEYKILTEIAELLGDDINASGTIKLFTELDTCASCTNVIGLFSAVYEHINIEIIHNNGIRLKP